MWGKAGERVMANVVTAAAFLNIANITGLLSMQKPYQNFQINHLQYYSVFSLP